MACDEPLIHGVPFMALYHHDGRFIRTSGLFAFARRLPGGRHLVLHLELTEAINRRADVCHPRWSWALSQGMNELLVHMAGGRASVGAASSLQETVVWHPEAQVLVGEDEGLAKAVEARGDAGSAVVAPDDGQASSGMAIRTAMSS
jgi:hypothetical protein